MSAFGMLGSKISTFGPRSGLKDGFCCASAAGAQPLMKVQVSRMTRTAESILAELNTRIHLCGCRFRIAYFLIGKQLITCEKRVRAGDFRSSFISPSSLVRLRERAIQPASGIRN